MRKKTDQRLVELHPVRGLRSVRGDRTFGALRRDRARAIGQQQADERLEREQVRRLRRESQQRDVGDFRQRAFAENVRDRHAAETIRLMAIRIDRRAY